MSIILLPIIYELTPKLKYINYFKNLSKSTLIFSPKKLKILLLFKKMDHLMSPVRLPMRNSLLNATQKKQLNPSTKFKDNPQLKFS